MKNPIKQILKVGAPLLASQLAHYLLNIADMAMVGRLSNEDLAAIGMAGLFTGVIFVLIWPISVGTQVIASRRFGREEAGLSSTQETAEVLNNSLLLSFVIGITAYLLSFSAWPVLRLIIKDEQLLDLSMQYIKVYRWGYLIAAPAMAYQGFFSSVQKTRIVMVATMVANGSNIFFNYIFIFGKLGMPRMELQGAALGTVLSLSLSTLVCLVFALSNKDLKRYPIHRFSAPDRSLIKRILSHAAPPMVQNGIAMFIFLLYEGMVANMGTIYLAVTHVVFALFRINKTLVGGFARGAAILVGNSLGVKKIDQASLVIRRMQLLAVMLGTTILLLIYLFPAPIYQLFSPDPAALPIAIKALRFFCFFFFIEIVSFSLEIIFQSNGWGGYVLISEFSTNILFILLFTWFFAVYKNGGISIAWLGFALYQVGHSLILSIGWLSGLWKKQLSRDLH